MGLPLLEFYFQLQLVYTKSDKNKTLQRMHKNKLAV